MADILNSVDTKPDFESYLESYKPVVKATVAKVTDPSRPDSRRLAGFVVDMLYTTMIDVANEFGVPSYLFFPSNATFLGLQLHVQYLYDVKKYDVSELKDSKVTELEVPSLTQLEPQAMKFFSSGDHSLPTVYTVGPVLNIKINSTKSGEDKQPDILKWLDEHPRKSVVFLCFGSMGGSREEQAKEIAIALERSGHRFVWSLRRAQPEGTMGPPGEFTNLDEVLPEGFVERTAEIR
ncbi:PREDICTED: UDP-glycosyltransferase 71B2-like [Camelina sativa]|uniref:UDP-glycosyltransferase 71B2-like n=1 Tax=Camelina sativa TaxID=90675 RepID=A0ABM0T4F7_CAMSA|nr:PREDICTED: UDP-glycosyltransferase 71B2-like [Camelina sativa]